MTPTSAPDASALDDEVLRARYVDEVLGVLYPPSDGADLVDTEFLVVPHARRPRLLVPAHDRRVAAAAVRRRTEPRSRLGRLKRDALVAAVRTGLSRVLLRDRLRVAAPAGPAAIDGYLRQALARNLHVSIHIGPAWANRKPVLQLLTQEGQTVAFAKLGTSGLTRRLVRAETTALIALRHAGLAQLTVPRVLHAGRWRGHEVLVQSALPVWRPGAPLPVPTLAAAMREVANCCGIRRAALRDSAYWARLYGRLTALAGHPEGPALLRAADRILTTFGGVTLTYGSWHGDWAPWNMAPLNDTILVWNWERFSPGVPMGFDALHHALHGALIAATRVEPDEAVDDLLADATDLLRPFGVAGRQAVESTTLLYLIDLAARHLSDRQPDGEARPGVPGAWLLPVLLARVAEL